MYRKLIITRPRAVIVTLLCAATLLAAVVMLAPLISWLGNPVAEGWRAHWSSAPANDAGESRAGNGSLSGAAAIRELKQQGAYPALAAAVTTATYAINQSADTSNAGGEPSYNANNSAQALRESFSSRGVQVYSSGLQPWKMGLQLQSYGYGDRIVPLTTTDIKTHGNRIEFSRNRATVLGKRPKTYVNSGTQPTIVEWYENKPEGLEQGFTIARRPAVNMPRAASPAPRLHLTMTLTGDLRARTEDGQTLKLEDRDGRQEARYDHLQVQDATGRELAARLAVHGRELRLEIDDTGAAYPITVDPTVTSLQAKLTASDGQPGDIFGCEVAISGDTIVVGAADDDGGRGNVHQGAAYVFRRQGSGWKEEKILHASDGKAGDQFGAAVAINFGTIVIGARFADQGAGDTNEGAAYVYTRRGNDWIEQKLIGSSAGQEDHFGFAVAIFDKTIVVGAPEHAPLNSGIAYVFTRSGTVWGEQTTLRGGTAFGEFGYSVAIAGDSIVVGSPQEFVNQVQKGAAYVFVGSDANWPPQQQLVAGDGGQNDNFGFSVGISNDTVIVGAPFRDFGQSTDQGAVYFFTRRAGVWSGLDNGAGLSAADAGPGAEFGDSVDINGDRAIIGAFKSSPNADGRGAAYLIARNGASFSTVQRLADGEAGDNFGVATAIDGDTVVVGALKGDGKVADQGAVFVYQSPDSDGDGLPDDWEINGVTVDAAGHVIGVGNAVGEGTFIDLPGMGANPLHKDIFVHADWMQQSPTGVILKPNPKALKLVTDSFLAAPVDNPDRVTGISLHIDAGPDSIMNPLTGETWGVCSATRTACSHAAPVPFQVELGSFDGPEVKNYNWTAFDAVKALNFGTAQRAPVFHYALFCNTTTIDSGILGLGRAQPGADFLVALGAFKNSHGSVVSTPLQQALRFMHELGHNLGLQHGGSDEVNWKPNYLSIMNYRFQDVGLLSANGKQRKVDYSRLALPDLNERNLREPDGINDPAGHLTTWNSLSRPLTPAGSNKCQSNINGYWKIFLPNRALDWNCDGLLTASPVVADLNSDGKCVRAAPGQGLITSNADLLGDDEIRAGFVVSGPDRICQTVARPGDIQLQAPGTAEADVLFGANDWLNLVYNGGGRLGALQVKQPDPLITEVDEPPLERLQEDIPPSLIDDDEAAPADNVAYAPQAGAAPLLVTFDGTGSTAVSGAIVNWQWDFGDGTSGAGATVIHTYNTTGSFYVSLTVTDSSGRVNLVPLLNRVTVTGGAPNLTPVQPDGWSDKIVVSKVTGTNTDSPQLTVNDLLFVDWAARNSGGLPITTAFTSRLYVDGFEKQSRTTNPPLNAGDTTTVQDVSIGSLSEGQHTIRIVLDTESAVTESNEADNVYTRIVNIASGSSPTPSPTPNGSPTPQLNAGDLDPSFQASVTSTYGRPVNAVATQADGKIIVGGDFDSFAGYARKNIARLNPDGTADTTFDPGLVLTEVFDDNLTVGGKMRVSLIVNILTLQPDNKILVGLQRTRGNRDGVSVATKMIVRLNPDGTLDTSFDANSFGFAVASTVNSIALQPDGRIIVGGSFVYGTNGTRTGIARLNPDGSVDPSFNLPHGSSFDGPTNNSGTVPGAPSALTLQADGKILISGLFTAIGPRDITGIARLNADGSLDAGFNTTDSAGLIASNLSFPTFAIAIIVQPNGQIVLGGSYHNQRDAPLTELVRLNPDGSRDTNFVTFFSSPSVVHALIQQADGKLLVGGDFQITNPVVRNSITRLNPDGSLDLTFATPGLNTSGSMFSNRRLIYGLGIAAGGKIVAVGDYDTFNSLPAESILQINADGSRDASFESNGPGTAIDVDALVRQPDGKIVVGFFPGNINQATKLNSVRLGALGRLNADGSTDTTFTSPFDQTSVVTAIALQPDGKIIVSGDFRQIGSQTEQILARLNADGTLDSSFVPPSNVGGPVVILPDGKIIAAGLHEVVRLNSDGSRDNAFSRSLPNGGVNLLAVQADGRIVIAGFFSLSDGRQASLARLNVDGSFDPTFDPGSGADDTIRALVLQPDGKIVIGGKFYNYNGTARNRMARVNVNGSLDTSFNPFNPNNRNIGALALEPDGKIFAGIQFSANDPSSTLAPIRVFRLNPDGQLDTSFPITNSGIETANGAVDAILLQADGNIVIGGRFVVVNGVARLGLARLIAGTGAVGPSPTPTPTPTATPTPSPSPSPPLSSVQFSSPDYSVAEGAGFATITVTRSGDTSAPVTVDYQTNDVGARQRTDFTIGAGTLNFAAGEASKTFAVLVVDDVYLEGGETLNLSLSNPTGGALLGTPAGADLTIVDNDSASLSSNPADESRFFVQQHYYDFLSRYPDPAGWDFWSNKIAQCGPDAACVRQQRIEVSNAFFYELEFQQTGAYAYRLYRAAYGNNQPFANPDTANQPEANKLPSYAVFARDRARVVGGADLAQEQLELAKLFVRRPEFLARYPANEAGSTLVDSLLTTIRNDSGADLSAQRPALINLYQAGGPALVIYRLADDNIGGNPVNNRAFIDAEYNRAFVFTEYAGYLRRDPDIGGLLFWLGQVNSGPLRDVNKQHAMVCSFLTSTEYQLRFGSTVSHANDECGQ